MKILPSLVMMVALAASASPRASAVEKKTASAEDWYAGVACLEQVDKLVQSGNVDRATLMLKERCEVLPAPLSEVAHSYRQDLQQGTRLCSDSEGLARLAQRIGELDDSSLRQALEDKLLAIEPPPNDACAAVLMARALRAFKNGDLDRALQGLVDTQERFPGSSVAPLLLYNEAIVLRELKRYQEAIQAFKQLLATPVDNDEFYATSVMDAGYRNYYFRSAINLSWCYEQVHDYPEAYRWIELAGTKYPYKGWCNVEINGNRRYRERAADRIAWKTGGTFAVRHYGGSVLSLWYAWMPWLLLLAIWASPFRRMLSAKRVALSIVFVGLGVAIVVALLHAGFLGDLGWYFSNFWLVRWAVPGALLLVALALSRVAPRAARPARMAAFVFAAIGHALWLWWFVRFFHAAQPPFLERQLTAYLFFIPAAAVIIGSSIAFLADVRREPLPADAPDE